MLLLQVKNSRKDQFFIKGEDVLLKTISGLIDNTETSVAEFFGETATPHSSMIADMVKEAKEATTAFTGD